MVEAIVSNSDFQYLPGQFVTMDIATGERSAFSGNSACGRYQGTPDLDGKVKHFVWVATKSTDGFTAKRRDVEIGDSSSDKVSIRSGLTAGEQVVVQGGTELADGQMINPSVARRFVERQ